jgi:cytochrome c
MRRILLAILIAAATGSGVAAQGDPRRGEALVRENCGACHAVGRTGDSPEPKAPALRTLASRYPLENLQEALAEGIAVGHSGVQMPEFVFEPDQIDDIILYLKSISVR